MKVKISFKTPDVLDYALNDIDDEADKAALTELASEYIQYEEYLTVEFDTVAGTATVVTIN